MVNISKVYFLSLLLVGASGVALASPQFKLSVSSLIWDEFSLDEQSIIVQKFSDITIIPKESIGIIQGVQVVNRSVDGTNSGTVLGSAFAQAAYVDRSIGKGNYSAKNHLGMAIFGGLLGSSLDSPGVRKYILSYSVKTLDGQIRRVEIISNDEIYQPTGQCINLPLMEAIDSNICTDSKVSFLKRLSAVGGAPENAKIIGEAASSPVKCQIQNVGMMMLEKNVCLQMEGIIEK
jgi:outer membrane lipoprotein SlyB